ncbi:protein kinase [Trypanosoma theileri]|uniref:non-specific serine/threonine protein kinase n=1 Tax=Trypanosoma theileri TaxID=67003 RepID=A0A1X0NKA1_9TRYP|nr:protein kinase [Trypanosoma theileri]ORC85021.1 protein kinase [Trypanosoma theileri]
MSDLLEIPGEFKTWVLRRHRILGKGNFGCATLYEEVNNPGNFVVVKDVNMQTMKKEDEMKALEMEVTILRRSRGHPNIVQFLDYYHDGEFMAYIVMEYCERGDLAKLEEESKFRASHQSESFVASVLIQMLAGLYFLHVDQHTLHRDIKPQNLFLCSDYTLRIGDFGVSTILEQFGSVAKAVCGSPFYMAPELCEEKAYDGKADIWSLGVTLYELMVMERPFDATSVPALTRQITRGTYNPIPSDLPYSRQLVELVQSFLQVSTTTRPTLRRALRSTFVQSHLSSLPLSCLESSHYSKLFGEDLIENAIKNIKKVDPKINNGKGNNNRFEFSEKGNHTLVSSSPPNDMSELEKWLETGKDAAEDFLGIGLQKREVTVGLGSNQRPNDSSITEKQNFLTGSTPLDNISHQKQQQQQQLYPQKNDAEEWDNAYEDDFESESSSNSQ